MPFQIKITRLFWYFKNIGVQEETPKKIQKARPLKMGQGLQDYSLKPKIKRKKDNMVPFRPKSSTKATFFTLKSHAFSSLLYHFQHSLWWRLFFIPCHPCPTFPPTRFAFSSPPWTKSTLTPFSINSLRSFIHPFLHVLPPQNPISFLTLIFSGFLSNFVFVLRAW